MAADQRRKRMNSANVIGFSSREHYRAKRKKMGSPDGGLSSGDHISLEWDGDRNKVVSKREQVGLSLRHLRQFADVVPRRGNILAQVCPVPQETFELENLSEVITNEVWRACLSEGERNYLRQFLPVGVDVEQVVKTLLDGENFHFGNPFLDWGIAVCSSEVHPDQIVSREECLRAGKSRYYSDLEKYHYDIIDYLQLLKDKWEMCKDPEKGVLKKMWGRSRGNSARVNDSCHDLTAASESSSWNADEKQCSSDNKTSTVLKIGDVQRRPKRSTKTVDKEKYQSPSIAPDNIVNVGVKARKKDKLPKHSIQQTDGAKYMSYLKISKKQHQIVTSMKQSGKSIQSRALNRILGNINNLDVLPYGVFVEEEQKKLNAHWLQLVRGLPAAYAIWKKLQLQKREIVNSVERELKDKLNPWVEDKPKLYPAEYPLQKHDVHLHLRNNDTKRENKECLNPNQNEGAALDFKDSGLFSQLCAKSHSPSKDSSSFGDQITDSGRCLQVGAYPLQGSSPNCGNSGSLEDIDDNQYSSPCSPCSPSKCHNLQRKHEETNEYSSSIQVQSLPQPSFSSEPHPSDLNDTNPVGNHIVSEIGKASSNKIIPCIASSDGEDSQFCSAGDVWQPVGGIRHSYIDRQAYTPSGGLSIIHHPEGDEEGKNCFIDLESDMRKEVDRKKMLQLKSNDSFGSFPNNDQNELLQSLFKGQGVASRSTEQLHSLLKGPLSEEHKQIMGMDFQQEGSNNLGEGGQFPGQFHVQLPPPHAPPQDQQRQMDIYGQGSMADNIYCDGRGFLLQRPDWNSSSGQIGVTIQPRLNTGPLLSQNWQFRSMWANTNGVGCASQGNQTGSNRDQSLLRVASNTEQIQGSTSDQSLFSVLSQCSQLRHSRSTFEPESSNDQLVASGNYGMLMGGSTTQVGSNLAQPANPLNYLSGSNPGTSLMPDDVGWMNQGRQNSSLHDPLGKLYPRSWNP